MRIGVFLLGFVTPAVIYGYLKKYQPDKAFFVDKVVINISSRQLSECKNSTVQGLSAFVTVVGIAHLFRQSISNRRDIDHKAYFAGVLILTGLVFNPFPHARIIGALIALGSFTLPPKPKLTKP